MDSNIKKSIIGASFLVVFGIVSRFLLVNQPNVSGLEMLALFGGAYFMLKRFAFIIPLAAYILSDFIINNTIYSAYYDGGLVFFQKYMIGTIAAIALIVLFAKVILKKVNLKNSIFGVLGATTIFWIVSNFATWMEGVIYPVTFSGFVSCYVAAIPFYGYSLLGNTAFAIVLFGGYEWMKHQAPEYALETAKV